MEEELANLRKQQEEMSIYESHQRKQDEDHGSRMESSHRGEDFEYGVKIVPDSPFSASV